MEKLDSESVEMHVWEDSSSKPCQKPWDLASTEPQGMLMPALLLGSQNEMEI